MAWECYRLRAAIVDFAEGDLEERARTSVERHLAACPACSAAVLELREVPAELRRRLGNEPSEAFFAAQRDAILRAVDRSVSLPAPRPQRSRLSLAIRFGSLAAAAAAAFVFVSTWSSPPEVTQVTKTEPTVAAERAPIEGSTTTSVEAVATTDPWSADEGSLLSLADDLLDAGSDDSAEGAEGLI